MLDRVESERRESARRALAAQEEERLRIARELHDEVGQALTAVLLQLDRAASGEQPAERIAEAREAARATLEEVRAIARNLRPEALDDLGLAAALRQLCNEAERAGVEVERRIAPDVRLAPEVEVVVYRVAQEAITNVLRHAAAERLVCVLERAGSGARLLVVDDGRGRGDAPAGSGLQGMRERAVLAGATLEIEHACLGRDLCQPAGAMTRRILLADDHAMVRRGLRLVLDAQPDLEVVAEAGDGVEALDAGLRDEVDLAVLDVSMPRMTGLQAAAELSRRQAGAADPDALDARIRAVPLRGAEGGRVGLRAEVGRRS